MTGSGVPRHRARGSAGRQSSISRPPGAPGSSRLDLR
jgi:hypothetical protein